jgi:mercuric ion transport protein
MTEGCCETATAKGAENAMQMERPVSNSVQKVAIVGGILGAIGAATCCVIPFALFSVGVSGAWIGNLTALEPYQPLFGVAAFGFIGYGAYRLYAKRKAECANGGYCATPQSDQLAKLGLFAATVLVIGALSFPYLIRAIVS